MTLNARSVNRLTAAVLGLFALIVFGMAYWSVLAADSLAARSDNPRQLEAEQMRQRGALYDRSGSVLAYSAAAGRTASGQPLMQRQYPEPDAISAVGYFSVTQGVSGAEQMLNGLLRGDPVPDAQRVSSDLLHRPPVGRDVRLSLDLPTQQAAAAAMRASGAQRGAVVALDVPTGAIRVLYSAPGYDPSTFDNADTFNALLKDPAAPLLNRALQGSYQPGGALETVVLSALLTGKTPLDETLVNATQPVALPDVTLVCALSAKPVLTLQNAFADACPAPFASAALNQNVDVSGAIQAFGLTTPAALSVPDQTASLANATPTAISTPTHSPTPAITLQPSIEAQAAGQGTLTVSPLQMALVAATIANHGNSIPPYLAEAARASSAASWQPLTIPDQQPGVIAQPVADAIRAAMRTAVTDGAAHAADQAGLTIYGHASLAYFGPQKTPLAWFIGFVDLSNGQSVAVAVVLENVADPSAAAVVGGTTLRAAAVK